MRSRRWSLPERSPSPDSCLCVTGGQGAGRSTLRSGQRPEPLHAIIIFSEVANQYAEGLIDVESADRNHLLEVGPVLRPVEERLEYGEIGTAQERDAPAAKVVELTTLCRLDVQISRVEGEVDGR